MYFSDLIGIPTDELKKKGLINQPVNMDDPYYLNILAFKDTDVPEFKDAYSSFIKRFNDVFELIRSSRKNMFEDEFTINNLEKLHDTVLKNKVATSDQSFKSALLLVTFHEREGFNIGYSKKGKGRGIGLKFGLQLLLAAKRLIESEITDPEVFCLLPFFETGIGKDRISDCFILINYNSFVRYTSRLLGELGSNKTTLLPRGELKGSKVVYLKKKWPLILLHTDFLLDLDEGFNWFDIIDYFNENSGIKDVLNKIIKDSVKKDGPVTKSVFSEIIVSNPDLLKKIVREMVSNPSITETKIRAIEYASKFPIEKYDKNLSLVEIVELVNLKFKFLVERKNIKSAFYIVRDKIKVPLSESHIQKFYETCARAYLIEPEIHVIPEMPSAGGRVDFCFIRNSEKVLLEMKLSTHDRIKHGLITQLRKYIESDNPNYSFYMIVELTNIPFESDEADKRRVEGLNSFYLQNMPEDIGLEFVNARLSKSPSQ